MQTLFLEVLQQGAASRMDNAFRNSRGSGRIQYVKRVREGQPLKSQRFTCEQSQGPLQCLAAANRGGDLDRCAKIVGDENLPHAYPFFGHRDALSAGFYRLAVVPIAVRNDQQDRLDLPESVKHALFAEIRGA